MGVVVGRYGSAHEGGYTCTLCVRAALQGCQNSPLVIGGAILAEFELAFQTGDLDIRPSTLQVPLWYNVIKRRKSERDVPYD